MSSTHARGLSRDGDARSGTQAELRPKDSLATARRPVSRKAQGKTKGASKLLVALSLLLAVWAIAASWFAWSMRETASRIADEQAELRFAYEEKYKGLMRRLVGVTSHQALEQDGLSGRLADIISRQVELENRQSMLAAMAEKLGVATGGAATPPAPVAATVAASPAPPAPRAAPEPVRAAPEPAPRNVAPPAPEVPTLRLGGPRPPDSEPAPAPGRRSSLDIQPAPEPARPAAVAGTGRTAALLAGKGVPLREQFSILEASIGQIERGQVRVLNGVAGAIHHTVTSIRTAVTDLGLNIPLEKSAEPPKAKLLIGAGKAAAPDPFEARYAALEADLGQFDRLRGVVDAVPLRKPVEGGNNLTSNFGTRKDPFTGATATHAGMDFRGPIGTPIRASASGRVVTAGVTGGYGNLVEVEHGNGILTRYAHLSAFNVSVGQSVTAGTVVGALGSTGRSTGPHLHYETRINGSAVDPVRFLQAGAQLFDEPISTGEVSTAGSGDDAFD